MSVLVDDNPQVLSPPALRASADADQAVHFTAKVDHVASRPPWASHQIAHAAGLAVDHHRLKNVERARYVLFRHPVGFKRFGKILPATVFWGDHFFSA